MTIEEALHLIKINSKYVLTTRENHDAIQFAVRSISGLEPSVNIIQSIELVDKALATIKTSYDMHIKFTTAIDVLAKAILKPDQLSLDLNS